MEKQSILPDPATSDVFRIRMQAIFATWAEILPLIGVAEATR
jgi:hypothetical protein